MKNNTDSSNRNIIAVVIATVIISLYLITPPYDKFAQLGYFFNNIKLVMCSKETDAYIFHRNNAIYLTRMDNHLGAVSEMDKAVAALPNTAPDSTLYGLYRDRASIKMYYGDYKGALNDFLRIPSHGISDYLAIAMLFKECGKRKMAVSYCNKIIDIDLKAYAGYACLADIYADVGKYEAAVAIYDLLIDRSPNKAKYYADRAAYKEKAGDRIGAKDDYEKAKELSPLVDYKYSITYDVIHPKKLTLPIL